MNAGTAAALELTDPREFLQVVSEEVPWCQQRTWRGLYVWPGFPRVRNDTSADAKEIKTIQMQEGEERQPKTRSVYTYRGRPVKWLDKPTCAAMTDFLVSSWGCELWRIRPWGNGRFSRAVMELAACFHVAAWSRRVRLASSIEQVAW